MYATDLLGYICHTLQGVVDKFTKLSKIGVCLEFLTAIVYEFSSTIAEIWLLMAGWGLANNLKLFRDFLEISYVYSCSAICTSDFGCNNPVPIHLW